ncbi:uncharacterized protein [Halyomorpha halys]|uniref:uncharacterized protein n=1 Tax=Halyomorpha halys TaxID=286706 RepID=UPI0034D19DBB
MRIRLVNFISQFTTDIHHLSGEENTVTNAFSRVEDIECTNDYVHIAPEQQKDPTITELQKNDSLQLQWIKPPGTVMSVLCETFTSQARPYVPRFMGEEMFHSLHGLSHPGIRASSLPVTAIFCPSMNADVSRWARCCIACQKSKVIRHTVIPPGGIQRNRTTAYHSQSNGCMERVHKTLKASLMSTLNLSGWTSTLPTVLLGLRSPVREDVGASAAEMVFEQPLRFPEFFEASGRREDSEQTLKTLREAMKNLRPALYCSSTSMTFVHRDLKDCTHIFLRDDSVRVPFTPPYSGPYRVISWKEKTCKIQLPSGPKTISMDRLKVALLPGANTTLVERNADAPQPSPTPAAGSANSSNDLDAEQH